MRYNTIFQKFPFIAIIMLLSCEKFLDVGTPSTSISEENVYNYDFTASAVLTGIYTQMMSNDFSTGGLTSFSLLQELAGDNLVLYDPNITKYVTYWRNSYTPAISNSGGINNYYTALYPRLFTINAAIEGLNKSTTLTPAVKKRLLGESYFLRSLYYFYLVNLFGEVPLVTSTDYTINSTIPRSPVNIVYKQILADLQNAINHLDDKYVDATIVNISPERVRPNLSAAQALLSRVELYLKDYESAELFATKVIEKTDQYALIGLDSVFLKNSTETIWSLQPVNTGYNTNEGAVFLLTKAPTAAPKCFYLSSSLISNFESGDQRLIKWIGNITNGGNTYPFAAKYKADVNAVGVTEYCVVIRLAELYLIRSEARLRRNNITGARDDLNAIRKRAGLSAVTTNSADSIYLSILKERRSELFTEWGHRWFDLKRTGKLDDEMQKAMSFKGGTWSSYKAFFPIPNTELIKNQNLTQNPGY